MLVDRSNSEFLELCIQASDFVRILGYVELSHKFLWCEDFSKFKSLCYQLEDWDGNNPHGDVLMDMLRDINNNENILQEMTKELVDIVPSY